MMQQTVEGADLGCGNHPARLVDLQRTVTMRRTTTQALVAMQRNKDHRRTSCPGS